MKILSKKGMETVLWVLLVMILAIVVLLIFFVFIRGGFTQIKGITEPIFGGLGNTS